jgi:cytochrome c
MNRVILIRGAATAWLGMVLTVMAAGGAWAKQDPPKLPAELQAGETKFKANCAACHGEQGIGTIQGPPLVHKIYEPNHHGDAAFQRAAASGVRAHHWSFGNMPKIESVTPQDVDQITKYVRWLQRQAGIQ